MSWTAQWLNTDLKLFRVVLHSQALNRLTFAHWSLLFAGMLSIGFKKSYRVSLMTTINLKAGKVNLNDFSLLV